MGVYALKPGFQRLLRPIIARLVGRNTSPDAVTAAGVVFAGAAGLALAASPAVPWLVFVVPVAVGARLAANAVDGQVARAGGGGRPFGMVWNEMGDRLGDVAVFAPFAFVPGVPDPLVLVAVVSMLLASSLGVLGATIGGNRTYAGPMAKPDRMVVVAIAAPLAFWLGPPVLVGALWVVVVGVATTFGRRWATIAREAARDG